jgi:ABC-type transporter Mla subunit MlaD
MFNAVQLFFKKIWENILFPALVFLLIAILLGGIAFALGYNSGKTNSDRLVTDTDRQLGEYRAELDRERQTIDNLKITIEGLAESNILLQDSLNRASQTIDDISGTISGLEKLQGSNVEKLRGVITGLKQIQASIKGFGNP